MMELFAAVFVGACVWGMLRRPPEPEGGVSEGVTAEVPEPELAATG